MAVMMNKPKMARAPFVTLSFSNDKSGNELLSFGCHRDDAIAYAAEILKACGIQRLDIAGDKVTALELGKVDHVDVEIRLAK